MFKIFFVRRKPVFSFFLVLFLQYFSQPLLAADGDYYFPALGYRDTSNQFPVQNSPQETCNVVGSALKWNKLPYSYSWIPGSPGYSICQRYVNGIKDSSSRWIKAVCQRNAAPIRTGSDWSNPRFDGSYEPPCSCYNPKKLDRSVEWCTANPSCLFYPDNKLTECGRTVEILAATVKDATDPTRIFHDTQTCIASRSCNLRCKMDNCNWLKSVIPDFVNPYLQKTGEWPIVEANCANPSSPGLLPLRDRLCAANMARNHIYSDLEPAIIKSGCGSDADWAQVFVAIEQCTAETFSTDAEKFVATRILKFYREEVRSNCLAARTSLGLNKDINDDLRGKICVP